MPPARFPCVIYQTDHVEIAPSATLGAVRISIIQTGAFPRHVYIGAADVIELMARLHAAAEALRQESPA